MLSGMLLNIAIIRNLGYMNVLQPSVRRDGIGLQKVAWVRVHIGDSGAKEGPRHRDTISLNTKLIFFGCLIIGL